MTRIGQRPVAETTRGSSKLEKKEGFASRGVEDGYGRRRRGSEGEEGDDGKGMVGNKGQEGGTGERWVGDGKEG